MGRKKLTKLAVSILVALVLMLLVATGLSILEAANLLGPAIVDVFTLVLSGLIGTAWALYITEDGVL